MKKGTSVKKLVEQCVQGMERMHYQSTSIAEFKRQCRLFSEYLAKIGADEVFTEEVGAKYLKDRFDFPYEYVGTLPGSIRSAVCCVRRLGEMRLYGTITRTRQTKADFTWAAKDMDIINTYVESVQARDTSEATKKLRIHHIKLFYDFLCYRNIKSISKVTPQVLSDYAASLQGGSLIYSKHRLATLRYYLRFLFTNGLCKLDLSYAVPKVKNPQHSNVPTLWTEDEIRALLKSIDRGSPAGKRDYAVILMVVQLGIRIADIAGLQLENLKWERKEIEFSQHKTGKRIVHPMLNELGWAVIDYLRNGRPTTEVSNVFVTFNAPYTPLKSQSIGAIFARQKRRCGIVKKGGTTSGMHSLRHALARSLLEQEVPLPVLSEIMGHTTVQSSAPYLKVDIEGMRDCALSLEEVRNYG